MNANLPPHLPGSTPSSIPSSSSPQNVPKKEEEGSFNGASVTVVQKMESEKSCSTPIDSKIAVPQHGSSQELSSVPIAHVTDSEITSSPTSSSHPGFTYDLPGVPFYKERNAIPNLTDLLEKSKEEEEKGNDAASYLYQLIHDCYVEIPSLLKNDTPHKDQENTSELFRSAIKYANEAMQELKVTGGCTEAVRNIMLSATYLFQAGKKEQQGALVLTEAYHNLAASYYRLATATKESTLNKDPLIFWTKAVQANHEAVEALTPVTPEN